MPESLSSDPSVPGPPAERRGIEAQVLGSAESPLLTAAAQGDDAAMAVLLKEARPRVLRWAMRVTDDPDDAEDVTQLVLFRFLKGLAGFRGESRPTSWLYRVTLNEARALHRREARRDAVVREWWRERDRAGPGDGPAGDVPGQIVSMAARVATTLPPLQAAAFRLVDLEGMEPREAAQELGRSSTNLRSSLCRARHKVRRFLVRSGLASDPSEPTSGRRRDSIVS